MYRKHGMYKTRPYSIWNGMKSRCNNKKACGYNLYGGRGIKVCDEWNNFVKFWDDMKDGYKNSLTIDRIDNDGNYCKENCRWATYKEQNNNKRNNKTFKINGLVKSVKQWCDFYGKTKREYNHIMFELYRGENFEELLGLKIIILE
jgi:hypothetical protein